MKHSYPLFAITLVTTILISVGVINNISRAAEVQSADTPKMLLEKAKRGDIQAQFQLGINYFHDKEYSQSIQWFDKAAKNNVLEAQFNLGHMYLSGLGVKKNNIEAIKWWEIAAKSGYIPAQFNLGNIYYNGNLVTQDLKKSKYWLTQAANNNNKRAQELLSQLNRQHSSSVDIQKIKAYSKPSQDSVFIANVNKVDTAKVIKKSNGWLLISGMVAPVWIHKNYVRINDQTVTITSDNVNVRSKPVVTVNTLIGQLSSSTSGQLLEQKGDWYRISTLMNTWVKESDYSG